LILEVNFVDFLDFTSFLLDGFLFLSKLEIVDASII